MNTSFTTVTKKKYNVQKGQKEKKEKRKKWSLKRVDRIEWWNYRWGHEKILTAGRDNRSPFTCWQSQASPTCEHIYKCGCRWVSNVYPPMAAANIIFIAKPHSINRVEHSEFPHVFVGRHVSLSLFPSSCNILSNFIK